MVEIKFNLTGEKLTRTKAAMLGYYGTEDITVAIKEWITNIVKVYEQELATKAIESQVRSLEPASDVFTK